MTYLLAAYREEDVPFFPEVFVFTTPSSINAIAPGTAPITIGDSKTIEDLAEIVLKSCATLATFGWAIFVALAPDGHWQYGVFRAKKHSLAASADSLMSDSTNPAFLLLRNRGRLVVEVMNSHGACFTASFTSKVAQPSSLWADVSRLAGAVTCGIRENEDVRAYIRNLVLDRVQASHGTLIAVLDCEALHGRPESFRDSVWLRDPLSLARKFSEAQASATAEALAELQAFESLLGGMMNSDGVVLLGNNGTILGYRAFLKPGPDERAHVDASGGGRKRAFALLKARLGRLVVCCFIRSQDGRTECARSHHEQQ